MLTKDLLRVSRRGGGYQPEFVGEDAVDLAARVIGIYQGHVGARRGELQEALADLEREAEDHKLVRGFAKLLERQTTFEPDAPLPPKRTRKAAFEAGEAVGVVTESERERAIERTADRLGADPDAVERTLHADREENEVVVDLTVPWTPAELVDRYNCSLAQTALFDATEVRITTDDPRTLITTVKRLGLLYDIHRPEPATGPVGTTTADSEVVVTGPDALFRSTRRYGTRFADLLERLADAGEWSLTATIDDRGTERELRLDDDDPIDPPRPEGGGVDDPSGSSAEYDSDVEADFAARFEALDLDWELVREPDLLAAGHRAIVPDFAFDYRHADARVFFEIMGFWTPEYVRKKLDAFEDVDEVELVVAYDRSLDAGDHGEGVSNDDTATGGDRAVGDAIEDADHRAIPYRGRVRVKDVRDALRPYERELRAEQAAGLPDELLPEEDVVTLATLATRHGVSEDVIDGIGTPEHERVGRTLVRPAVLDALDDRIETGQRLSEAKAVLDDAGIDDASAALSALDYRVEWEGLGGGTIVEK